MKRLLYIFLIVAICFTSVLPVMPVAFAAEVGNYDLISYLTDDLAISSDGATRAEFTAGLVRLAYENVPGISESSFSDVMPSQDYANEIYTALSMGIISQSDKFNPADKITYTQAIKMAVCMLGYGSMAEKKGGYPNGYMYYGHIVDITLKGKANNDFLTYDDVVLLLSKVAEADVLIVSELNVDEINTNGTILSEIRGIYKTKGIITANEYTSLYSVNGAVRNGFMLGSELFRGKVSHDLLGHQVIVYYHEKNNDIKEACVVSSNKNSVVTLVGKDCEINNRNVLIDADDNEYDIDPAYNLIYNGKAYSKSDGIKFLEGADVKLTLIDGGSDGVYETVLVEEAAYMQVSRIENGLMGKALYDNEKKNSMVSLYGDVEYEVYVDDENGLSETSFENISINDLVAAYSSEDKKLVKLVICDKSIEGAVTSFSKTEKTVTIGDKSYYVNESLNSFWGSVALDVVQRYVMDELGRITAVSVSSSNAMYGWIVAAKKDKGIGRKITLKIFSENGEMELLNLADRVLIDGDLTQVSSLSENSFNSLTDDMRLVRFKKSQGDDPKITMIDYPTNSVPDSYIYMNKSDNMNDSMIRNAFSDNTFETLKFEGTTVGRYDTTDGRTVGYYHLDGQTKVFCIPETESRRADDKNYLIGTDGIRGGYEYSFAAYDMDVYAVPGAVVVLSSVLPTQVNDKTSFGIIETVSKTINEDGEQVPIVYMAVGNKIVPYYLDETIVSVASTLSPGDCVRFNSFENGYINAILKDYDFSDNEHILNSPRGAAYGHLDVGWIYSINNQYINLMPENKTSDLDCKDIIALNYASQPYGYVTYVYAKRATATEPAKVVSIRFEPQQEVRDYITSGQLADRAVVFGAYNNITNVVIYRFI